MKKLKIAIISLSICACIGSAIAVEKINSSIQVINTSADHLIYSNADDLSNYADLVIIGTPTKEFSEYEPYINLNSAGRIDDYCTFVEIKPIKILKGNVNGDIIKASQRAALIDNGSILSGKELLKNEEVQLLEKDRKYLLFLKDIGNGQYSIVSLNQGVFKLDNLPITDKLAKIASNDSLKANNQYNDLRNLVLEKYKKDIN